MSESFSTDLVPAAHRFDAWLAYAKQICGACRFHFPKHLPFHGAIDRRMLAGSAFTSFSSSPVSFVKFPAVASNCASRDFIVITQLQGTRCYCQNGGIAMLAPGDTTLIDAGQPWTSECAGNCERLYLRIPRWVLQDHLQNTSMPVLPRILGKQGLGATLFRLATSLYEEAETMAFDEGAIALEAYLEILAGCLSRPAAASTRLNSCAQLRPRIEHYIETHLEESKLNPSVIAATAGISVRHLHRLFAVTGWTVAEWIRERRLERCRCDLADPLLSDSTITEIAFHWGFSDSAHFSHCFRKEFGLSPRQFRSKALSHRWQQDFTRNSVAASVSSSPSPILHN